MLAAVRAFIRWLLCLIFRCNTVTYQHQAVLYGNERVNYG